MNFFSSDVRLTFKHSLYVYKSLSLTHHVWLQAVDAL